MIWVRLWEPVNVSQDADWLHWRIRVVAINAASDVIDEFCYDDVSWSGIPDTLKQEKVIEFDIQPQFDMQHLKAARDFDKNIAGQSGTVTESRANSVFNCSRPVSVAYVCSTRVAN